MHSSRFAAIVATRVAGRGVVSGLWNLRCPAATIGDAMRIAFMHYHLRPGGVTTVIRAQAAALGRRAQSIGSPPQRRYAKSFPLRSSSYADSDMRPNPGNHRCRPRRRSRRKCYARGAYWRTLLQFHQSAGAAEGRQESSAGPVPQA